MEGGWQWQERMKLAGNTKVHLVSAFCDCQMNLDLNWIESAVEENHVEIVETWRCGKVHCQLLFSISFLSRLSSRLDCEFSHCTGEHLFTLYSWFSFHSNNFALFCWFTFLQMMIQWLERWRGDANIEKVLFYDYCVDNQKN